LPPAEIGTAQQEIPVFNIFAQKGFQVKFENGYTVSVMFGAGNYCEHHHNDDVAPTLNSDATIKVWQQHKSIDAEIAVFDPDNNFVSGFPGCNENDQIKGWITPAEMLEVMNWAASQN